MMMFLHCRLRQNFHLKQPTVKRLAAANAEWLVLHAAIWKDSLRVLVQNSIKLMFLIAAYGCKATIILKVLRQSKSLLEGSALLGYVKLIF